MWKTWTLTAWRNFLKHKTFSLINVCGLSLGIACFIAILLYVFDEFKFDAFHTNADRIYCVNVSTSYDGSLTRYSTTSTPLAEVLRTDIKAIETAARLFGRQATMQVIESDSAASSDKKYRENNFYLADPSILKVFSFEFLKGNAQAALQNPNELIISRKIAVKYFGSIDKALGKQLMFEGSVPLQVVGVFEDYPVQSSNIIELVAHFENYYALETPEVRDFLKRDWLYNPVSTYILLIPGAAPSAVAREMQALNKRYADERVQQHVTYELQPLKKMHLYSDFTYASDRNAIRYIYIFLIIGMLILLIACINFINLSTVHSLRRSKEIGIRKVVGAVKSGLTLQFLFESLSLVFISSFLAVIGVYFALPGINEITGKAFSGTSLFSGEMISVLVITFLITGLIAGLYPALYISRFNPIAALKGMRESSSRGNFLIRRILVVGQFTASIVLIAFTIVINRQIEFMQDKPLGFQKEFMLSVPLFSNNPNSILGGGVGRDLRTRMNSFETELLNQSVIEAASVSSVLPGQGAVNALVTTDKIRETDNLFIPIVSVDYDFLDTYHMEVISGRGFDRAAGTDHLAAFIANEQALKVLGWNDPVAAVGQHVNALGKQATIIGVIKNYHFEGLQQPLRPLLMEVDVSKFTIFSLRLNGNDLQESVDRVGKVWNKIFPEKVFEYQFLDDQLQQSYTTEERFSKLINFFSALAIFISSLGLFGLAAYIGYQKQKEAGIRKVLGASTLQVFYALSREFIRIMVIAVCISMPLSYLISRSWLDDFAFQIAVGWLPFVASFIITTIIVFITTAYQTLRTASINPVNTIRNE